jgi:hypothetical protein
VAVLGPDILYVASQSGNNIIEIPQVGLRRTFASGLDDPNGLAFDSAGDLFEADLDSGNIYEFTVSPVEKKKIGFASGLDEPVGLAFQPAPEPPAFGLLAIGVTALLFRRRRCVAATPHRR